MPATRFPAVHLTEAEKHVIYDKSLMQISGDCLCLSNGRLLCTRSLLTDGHVFPLGRQRPDLGSARDR